MLRLLFYLLKFLLIFCMSVMVMCDVFVLLMFVKMLRVFLISRYISASFVFLSNYDVYCVWLRDVWLVGVVNLVGVWLYKWCSSVCCDIFWINGDVLMFFVGKRMSDLNVLMDLNFMDFVFVLVRCRVFIIVSLIFLYFLMRCIFLFWLKLWMSEVCTTKECRIRSSSATRVVNNGLWVVVKRFGCELVMCLSVEVIVMMCFVDLFDVVEL